MADQYNIPEVSSALNNCFFGGKLHYFAETDSTNTAAAQAADAGAEEGTVFLADQQTSGRGRNGHSWHSEAGTAILVSVVLRPRIAPAQALWLSLMAGVAVHDAIANTCGVECDLRWPNDLLIRKKKVCGILTEISADAEHLRHAVVGIGINVNQHEFPSEIAPLATSLQIETGKDWPRTDLLIAVLKSLESHYQQTLRAGSQSLMERLKKISTYIQHKRVHVEEAGGYEGTTAGVDQRGFLQVQTEKGMRTVISGGVREVAK